MSAPDSAGRVALEEVMTAALEAALEAAREAASDPHAAGRLFAYVDVLTVAKEQAEVLGVQFDDARLRDLDPYQLLVRKPPDG